ncbi:protein transport protein S31, partial [Modicella reniformis]
LIVWQEIAVILCAFACPDELGKLHESPGKKQEQRWISNNQAGEPSDRVRCNAVLWYLAAENLKRFVAMWVKEQEDGIARGTYDQFSSKYEHDARSLQAFIEKVMIFLQAIDDVNFAIA